MLTLPALTLLGLLSASSSLAAPVTPAVVGTVHCNITSIGNSLHLLSGPAGEYTGIDSPLGIYTDLTNDGTSDLGHHADEDAEETAAENAVKFDFYNCDSKFMGYKAFGGSGGSTAFGHLVVSESTSAATRGLVGQCATARSSLTQSTFKLAPCSFSDDSGQLFQYFALNRRRYADDGHTPEKDGRVYFLGEAKSSLPQGQTMPATEYSLLLGNEGLAYVSHPNATAQNDGSFLLKNITSVGSLSV